MNKILAAVVVGLLCMGKPAMADSLFTEEAAEKGTLISDKVSDFEEGDIITVLVRESIDASTQANTNTRKESDVTAEAGVADNPFLVANPPAGYGIFNPGELPNWAIEVENEHRARGLTDRTNTLTTTITCFVTEVLENGNIVIEGKKTVQVNREDSEIFVRGTVRARDVTPANTILSTQLANAEVRLKGEGVLWNNQRRGWFSKLLDWVSPF
jgi:flagellar L-ring protein FlgH